MSDKPITVGTALDDYFAAHSRRGGKALDRMKSSARTHIERQLGPVTIVKLTRKRLEQWHCDIAKSEPAARGKRGQPAGVRKINLNLDSRKRSATANRVLTILKAALNHARNEGHVSSDAAWDRVRAFREVDLARQRYLSDDETLSLWRRAPLIFVRWSWRLRKMVMAALLTGCRYGELCRLTCEDFSRDSGTILVRVSKSGKSRHIALPSEGARFFRERDEGQAKFRPDLYAPKRSWLVTLGSATAYARRGQGCSVSPDHFPWSPPHLCVKAGHEGGASCRHRETTWPFGYKNG
ncbi:integrase [Nitrobacteraceae bacterium AZCC 2161]